MIVMSDRPVMPQNLTEEQKQRFLVVEQRNARVDLLMLNNALKGTLLHIELAEAQELPCAYCKAVSGHTDECISHEIKSIVTKVFTMYLKDVKNTKDATTYNL